MITDNHTGLTPGDDTYTVRFWDTTTKAWDYVTVDSRLPEDDNGRFAFANMGQYLNSSTNVLWVALIEKAFVQVNESGWLGRQPSNSYAAIASGYPTHAAVLDLTGQDSQLLFGDQCRQSPEPVEQQQRGDPQHERVSCRFQRGR